MGVFLWFFSVFGGFFAVFADFLWFLRGFWWAFLSAGIRPIFCFFVGCENHLGWSIAFFALAGGNCAILEFWGILLFFGWLFLVFACFFAIFACFLMVFRVFCDFCVFGSSLLRGRAFARFSVAAFVAKTTWVGRCVCWLGRGFKRGFFWQDKREMVATNRHEFTRIRWRI